MQAMINGHGQMGMGLIDNDLVSEFEHHNGMNDELTPRQTGSPGNESRFQARGKSQGNNTYTGCIPLELQQHMERMKMK